MEKYFWSQEPLITNIDNELLLADCIDARVLFDPLPGTHVILGKFLDYIRANVTVLLLHTHRKMLPSINDCLVSLPSDRHTATPCIQDTPEFRSAHTVTPVWMSYEAS
jgi:hypothetical protein